MSGGTRRARARALGLVVAILVIVAATPGWGAGRPRVIVYGDSLVWESKSEIRMWAAARGYDAVVRARFGGAPCSLFNEMLYDRATHPAKVIVSFAGNTAYMAPCVGPDAVESHRAQVREIKRIWTGSGTDVIVASVPYIQAEPSEDVQVAMRSEAYKQGLKVADGGVYVTPGRKWYWTQPCMAGERCIGHEISRVVEPGRNIVRSSDRTHLCPGAPHNLEPCYTYSSGSWRYARAITAAISG